MLPFATIVPKVFEDVNTYVSFSEHVRQRVHSQYKQASEVIAQKRRVLVTMLSDRFRDVPGECLPPLQSFVAYSCPTSVSVLSELS